MLQTKGSRELPDPLRILLGERAELALIQITGSPLSVAARFVRFLVSLPLLSLLKMGYNWHVVSGPGGLLARHLFPGRTSFLFGVQLLNMLEI